jgi:hypothetical protein
LYRQWRGLGGMIAELAIGGAGIRTEDEIATVL